MKISLKTRINITEQWFWNADGLVHYKNLSSRKSKYEAFLWNTFHDVVLFMQILGSVTNMRNIQALLRLEPQWMICSHFERPLTTLKNTHRNWRNKGLKETQSSKPLQLCKGSQLLLCSLLTYLYGLKAFCRLLYIGKYAWVNGPIRELCTHFKQLPFYVLLSVQRREEMYFFLI